MNTTDALSFAAAAPFIVAIVAFIRNATPIELPRKWIPALTMALSFLWGAVLLLSGYYDADPAVFIITGISVALAANGIQAAATTLTEKKF